MIQKYVERFLDKKDDLKKQLKETNAWDYDDLVKMVIRAIEEEDFTGPNPNSIHKIDDGHYQGTLLFIIAAKNYQLGDYWAVQISYGSCPVCDTLQSIRGYGDDPITEQQVDDYYEVMLHIVQGLKKIFGEEEN